MRRFSVFLIVRKGGHRAIYHKMFPDSAKEAELYRPANRLRGLQSHLTLSALPLTRSTCHSQQVGRRFNAYIEGCTPEHRSVIATITQACHSYDGMVAIACYEHRQMQYAGQIQVIHQDHGEPGHGKLNLQRQMKTNGRIAGSGTRQQVRHG
nr:hypothetical protein CFP56_20952 [Quercus suber]